MPSTEFQHTSFYDGTISLTDSLGGHAYFIFNGTAIYLYGTRGPLYGEYSVSIDEKVVFNGYSGRDQLLFQQLLYSNANLPMGLHNVTLTNTWSNAARNFTDIDYVSKHCSYRDPACLKSCAAYLDHGIRRIELSHLFANYRLG